MAGIYQVRKDDESLAASTENFPKRHKVLLWRMNKLNIPTIKIFMKDSIIEIVEKYIYHIISDEFHRYKSWDNCFQSFSAPIQSEFQVLELAFYLASWGMYRGSGGLLQKNHMIHGGAVKIIYSSENQKMKCNHSTEVNRKNIKAILSIKNELAFYYGNFSFTKGAAESKPISTTDTLLSKIMLGTLGCVPAYDRYFVDGLKEKKIQHTGFNEASLIDLFNFIEMNREEFEQAQQFILNKTQRHYPIMKILDMYFWQLGYDKEERVKKQKKQN